MKIHYTRTDGTQSFFVVSVIKQKHGYKPILRTPKGLCYTLYRGKNISGFTDKRACLIDTIEVIQQHKENTINPYLRPRRKDDGIIQIA